MRLDHRVRWLERRLHAGDGSCKCGGRGLPAIFMTRSADQLGTHRGGCPDCGKANGGAVIVLPLRPGEDPASDPWDII
jgi:hypothetical protein